MSTSVQEYTVSTFYKFVSLVAEQLPGLKSSLEKRAAELDVLGLLLLAPEGVNATLVGTPEAMYHYRELLDETFGALTYKDCPSATKPFKRFKVKIKDEIVQLQRTDIQPTGQESHLAPTDWDRLMTEDNAIMIDVRNWYETKLGTFQGAISPNTNTFSEFPTWLAQADIPKQQRIGIFCTGGIRCEKAAVVMQEQGYTNVHQLDGGIINYIAQRPNENFAGECFVFDHRVAIDQNRQPSQQYGICTTCGNGGLLEQTCVNCQQTYRICDDCLATTAILLCSKNCRYRYAQTRLQ